MPSYVYGCGPCCERNSQHSSLFGPHGQGYGPRLTLTVEEVFVKTAFDLIREDESLEILAAAGIGWHRQTQTCPRGCQTLNVLPNYPNGD